MARQRYAALAAFVAAPLVVALTARRWESIRPQAPELRADTALTVISSRDSGGGSLREAIVAAARQDGRVRITVLARRITLLSPLPPLVNAAGVIIDATGSHCEIDARGIGSTPALQIAAPRTTILGLGIRNARDAAILVRANGALLREVRISDSADGVVLAGTRGTVVENSVFEHNGNGVRIDAASAGAAVRGCTFRRHDGAGIWAVAAAPGGAVLRIENNAFDGDRVSIVLVNLAATLTKNTIHGAIENAMYILQSRAAIRSNRILGGAGSGIVADRADGLLLDRNEVDHNAVAGVMIRSCRSAALQNNTIYSNAYGIATIFGEAGAPNVLTGNLVMNNTVDGLFIVGSSPLLRTNRLLRNGGAAARVLDYVPWTGPRVVSDPRFDANVIAGNRLDSAVRGDYRQPRPAEARE